MVVFRNPATVEKGAKATKDLKPIVDLESGEGAVPKSQTSVEVKTPTSREPQVPLFPTEYQYGLTGKGKQKTRKQKKRAPKKTQKRRSRK